jgi:hypothetical protein
VILQSGDIDDAIEHIKSVTMFGLVEEMERSALLLADALGLPAFVMGLRMNVTAERAGAPSFVPGEHERATALRANAADAVLLRAARQLFEERWATLLARYHAEDTAEGRAQLAQLLDEACRSTDRGVPRLTEFRLDLSRGVIADGWHPRFYYPRLERWLRWSEMERARVWLPLDRHEMRALRIEIAYATDAAARDALSVEIDGQAVHVQRTYEKWPEDNAFHLVINVQVPPVPDVPQYTEIAFRLPSGGAFALAGASVLARHQCQASTS